MKSVVKRHFPPRRRRKKNSFGSARTTLERRHGIARRQGRALNPPLACSTRERGLALFFFSRPSAEWWTVLECFRSQADMGKSSRQGRSLRVSWELRKSRVNQQQELSL